MTTPADLMPNTRAVVIGYLADELDDVTVLATLPDEDDFDDALPIVRVSHVGGAASKRGWNHGPMFDNPTVDIDVYSPLGPVEAENTMDSLVNSVRTALASMKGYVDRDNGGVVTKVMEIAGPAPRPETSTTVIRVGFTVGLIVRPL